MEKKNIWEGENVCSLNSPMPGTTGLSMTFLSVTIVFWCTVSPSVTSTS